MCGLIIKEGEGMIRSKFMAAFLIFIIGTAAIATPPFALNVSGQPRGVLSNSQTNRLWTAFETARFCGEHPVYGEGRGYRLKTRSASVFARSEWRFPFYPPARASGAAMVAGSPPAPVVAIVLDENYGAQNAAVGYAANWFSGASAALLRGASANTKAAIRQTLVDWARAEALKRGIQVSWGNQPVDWQVMTLISSIVTTTAAMAPEFTPEDRALIGPWLNKLVRKVAASRWSARQDNKAYMTAYITLVWAFMVSDKKAAQNAVNVVKLAVHDMRPDGSFPMDSERGGMGVNYSQDSAGYLIMMAALVRVNTGQDLFAYDAGGRTLHNAVDFAVRAIKDPSATNRIYAIPCPNGGDRWGSITNPSRHFITKAGFLGVYAALFPQSPHARYIRSRYGDGSSRTSELFGAPPGLLVRW